MPIILRRTVYILGYFFYRIYCFCFRPHIEGVQIIIRHQDEFFIVRHVYRNFTKCDFVGGVKEKNESFKEAGIRELFEETGIREPLVVITENNVGYDDFQKVTFGLYEVEAKSKDVRLDRGEIRWGVWKKKHEVAHLLSPFSGSVWSTYVKEKGL